MIETKVRKVEPTGNAGNKEFCVSFKNRSIIALKKNSKPRIDKTE